MCENGFVTKDIPGCRMAETKRSALNHRCRVKAAQNGRDPRQSPRRRYDAYQVTQVLANNFQASVTQMQWSRTDRLAAPFPSYRVTSKEQRLSLFALPAVNLRLLTLIHILPMFSCALFTLLLLKTPQLGITDSSVFQDHRKCCCHR